MSQKVNCNDSDSEDDMAQVHAQRVAATATKNKTPAVSTIDHSNSEAPPCTSKPTEHEAACEKVLAHVNSDEDLPKVLSSRRRPEATAHVPQALAKPRRTKHEAAHKKVLAQHTDLDEDLPEVLSRNRPDVPPSTSRRSEHKAARKKVSTQNVDLDEDLQVPQAPPHPSR